MVMSLTWGFMVSRITFLFFFCMYLGHHYKSPTPYIVSSSDGACVLRFMKRSGAGLDLKYDIRKGIESFKQWVMRHGGAHA